MTSSWALVWKKVPMAAHQKNITKVSGIISSILCMIAIMFFSSPVWGDCAPPVIKFTSKQMACKGIQVLTVSGGKGPFTWSIFSGGGTLSNSAGTSVTYAAPSSNTECANNPLITLTDSCGNVATLNLAVNCYPVGGAVAYREADCWTVVPYYCENPNNWPCFGRALVQHFVLPLEDSYNCSNQYLGGGWVDGCGCNINGCYSSCIEECADCATLLSECSPPRTLGINDMRTTAMKAAGCCPAALLPSGPPPCNLKITNFTGSITTIDPISGGKIEFSGTISETTGKPVKWILEVLGKTYKGSGSTIKETWDGKDGSGKVVMEGSYEATLMAETTDGQCKDTMKKSFTVKSNPKDCKLFVDFSSSANIASGNLYNSQTLFNVPNSKLLGDFTISYNSLDGNRIPLDTGWTHTYNINLAGNNDGSYTVTEGDGSRITLYKNGDSYTPEASSYPALVKEDDGTYLLSHKNGLSYTFSPGGKITRIEDRNANAITLAYDGSENLERISDPSGRTISLNYDGAKRITTIIDPNSNTHTFTYLGDNLATVSTQSSAAQALSWNFTYDANGFMLTKTDPQGFTTTYAYDENHRLIQSTDPDGKTRTITYNPESSTSQVTEKDGGTWTYKYDANLGVLKEKIDPQGGKTTYQYDQRRNLISETDPKGNTTSYAYDAKGNITFVKDPLGNTTTYAYSDLNQVTGITDPQGNVTRMAYDGRGNLASITDPTGATTKYAYDSRGNITEVTNVAGKKTTFTYDNYNNLTSTTDPTGASTKFSYDSAGNMTSLEDSLGNITWFAYDSLSQLIKTIDPLGNATSYSYDSKGKRTSVRDGNGNVTNFEYNFRGQVTKVTDALGNLTKFTYGGTGCPSCASGIDKLISVTDANGNTTSYQYDTLGRLIKETGPLGNTTNYSYDAKGNLTAKTDGNGNTIVYSYDSINRLTEKIYLDGTREVFQYDAKGNIIYAGNKDIAYNFTYDARGKIIKVVDSNGRMISYQYDALSNRTQMATPEEKTLTYSYDPSNRLTQILSDAGTFNFAYDSVGRRIKMSLSNRTFANYNYDAGSRLTNLTHKTSSGSIIDSFGYTHDHVGNRIVKTETDKKFVYYYDAIYRLLQALPTDHKGRHKYDHETEIFSYDSVGNRFMGPKKRDDYTYNKGNQLTSDRWHTYEYDKNGNLIKKTDLHGGEIYIYAYDYENRLTKVEIQRGHKVRIVTFTYDPFGRRISKSVHGEEIEQDDHDGDSYDDHKKPRTTYYFYDNENIIMEYNQKGKVTARYVHGLGIDEPLAVEKGRHAYYYHADGLGSIVGLTNQWGRVVQRYDYDSFGNMKPHWHLIKQPYAYTGREYDPETGLYYYRGRYYDARVGRFISKDIIGFAGGDVNLYGYVGNNPINLVDPFGLYGEDVHFGKTMEWALQVGIDLRIAFKIALANQRTDEALLTQPENPLSWVTFGLSFHFQKRSYAEKGLSQALDQGNIEQFGKFLHILQDSFSHEEINPLEHAYMSIIEGSSPDQYCEGSIRDKRMEGLTIWWLKEFERTIGKKYHPIIRKR